MNEKAATFKEHPVAVLIGSPAHLGLLVCYLLAIGLLLWSPTGWLRWFSFGVAVVGAGLWFLALWHMRDLRRVVERIVSALDHADTEQIDLSRALPERGSGQAQAAAKLFNGLMERTRETLAELQQHSLKVGLACSACPTFDRAGES